MKSLQVRCIVADTVCDDSASHHDFKDQLRRKKDDWHETGLMWKDSSISVLKNKLGNLERLKNLLQNLQRNQKVFERYDQVIQEQLAGGVVEKVNIEENCDQREFYLPHKAVIDKNAEGIELQTVNDASVRGNSKISTAKFLQKVYVTIDLLITVINL